MLRATIIGAGPAGSVAAIMLSRAGWFVTIVEQHRFPREKVCGECLSALGMDVLRRNGLLDEIETLGPAKLRLAVIGDQTGRAVNISLPSPMRGISRAAMDHALLNRAIRSGARVLQPWRCEAIKPGVAVRDLLSNQTHELQQDWILLADGKAAFSTNRPPPTRDMGIKVHFTGVHAPSDAIQLFGGEGHYGGVAPIEKGLFNVAICIPAARIADAGGDLRRILFDVLNDVPSMREPFRSATTIGPIMASPLPRFVVQDRWPERAIPLGNAAAAIEPIGGEGMGLAMRSAELACRALIDAHARRVPFHPHELRQQYRRLWIRRAWTCRFGGILMSSTLLSTAAMEILDANDLLLRGFLWMAGTSRGDCYP